MTRQLVTKAEDLLGSALKDRDLIGTVIGDSADLAQAERQQLQEIVRLQEQLSGEGGTNATFTCDGDFEVTSSDDAMFLTLTVRPPVANGEPVSINEVLDWLKQRQIHRGVDLPALKKCLQTAAEGEDVGDVVIVRGRYAKPGEDARIERYARRSADATLEPIGDRLADRGPGEALMCREGDVVLQYMPPVRGEQGHNAWGEPIEPAAPADLAPQAGPNITREENEFTANVNGVVLFEKNRVEARKALVINQELTRQSEPIDFEGDVQIRAAVRSGAHIRASGNIVVDGSVEAAEIESLEGDVVLRSGVAGHGTAVIRAGRDVHARFAESATVFAHNDINLQVGSLHSTLTAHRQITAFQSKGQLAGGVLIAGEKIVVKQFGAKGGVATDATVGLGAEALLVLSQIDQYLARNAHRHETCTELIQQMERAVGDPRKLQGKELDTYTRLRQMQLVCDVQKRQLNQRRRDVLADAAREYSGRIEVLLSVVSKVDVTIGGASKEVEARPGPCTIACHESSGKITVKPGVN